MATIQTFETIIKLNSQEAKNNLEQLRKKVDDLKAARDKAIQSKADSSFIKDINKDLKAARSELRSYEANVSNTVKTIENLSSSSVKDVKKAMRALKQEMDKTADPSEYAQLQRMWEECNERIEVFRNSVSKSNAEIRAMTNASQNVANVLKNINGVSLNALNDAASTVQQRLAELSPETDAYKIQSEELAKIKARIAEINESQKLANTTIDKYNQEIQQATAKSSDLKRENELIDRTLKNISGSTMRDLEYSLKLVNEQLRGTEQGTEEYEKLTKSAKQLKTQIAAINDEQKEYSRTYRCCHRYCSRSSADCHYQETASDAGGYRILRGWFHRWQELSP